MKKKIVGFTSKAGNVFDTCLKWEDDQIKFGRNKVMRHHFKVDPNGKFNSEEHIIFYQNK